MGAWGARELSGASLETPNVVIEMSEPLGLGFDFEGLIYGEDDEVGIVGPATRNVVIMGLVLALWKGLLSIL